MKGSWKESGAEGGQMLLKSKETRPGSFVWKGTSGNFLFISDCGCQASS